MERALYAPPARSEQEVALPKNDRTNHHITTAPMPGTASDVPRPFSDAAVSFASLDAQFARTLVTCTHMKRHDRFRPEKAIS
jgi:hypothetical protein